MTWETIVGLEIHTELNTKSKLFSSAPNQFGCEPNTNISQVCTGQPGSLPVLNKAAVHKAVLFGIAVGAEIAPVSSFDRKSYFYPDTPRNFQITQFYHPIIKGGSVKAFVDGQLRTFALDHAHLEDDSGTIKHFSSFAAVDYNRSGVPLIEIVSTPCFRSGKEAAAYAQAIKAILEYIDVSDCNMEEGSLRFDVNVSVRPVGDTELRTKIEIKNMNSFSFMSMAIDAEAKRQIALYERGETIRPATYRWDPDRKETVLMRAKESAEDYRYFPEPDLPPLLVSSDWVARARKELPELPLDKQLRYEKELALAADAAFSLTSDRKLALYFEEALKSSQNARSLANWLLVEFTGRLKDKGLLIYNSGLLPVHVAELVAMIDTGVITGRIAKEVADDMVLRPGVSPRVIASENSAYKPMTDESELQKLVAQVVRDNPQSVADFRAGKQRAFGFLVGQVMKLSGGTAQPGLTNELLQKELAL